MRHFTTFRLKSFHFTLNRVIEQVAKKGGNKKQRKKNTLLLRRSGEKERLVEIVV